MMTRGGVVGFPHRTRTEDTKGESAYVAAFDWRMWIRDSEKPLISTVILLCWMFCGSRFCVGPHWFEFEFDDVVVVKMDSRMVRIKVVVVGGFFIVVVLRLKMFWILRLLCFLMLIMEGCLVFLHSHMEINGFGGDARWM